jgi:MFS family permease
MTPFENRAVVSLAALYIFRMLGLFMVLPVLTLSSGEYAGSSVFLLGVALGAYGLTQALLQIPYGLLSDRFGRKPLIAIGLVVFAMGSVVAASADTIVGLIAGRALQGAGAIAGVIMAMVGDLTSEESRTRAMATIGASIGVAFGLSLVLGPLVMALGGVRWIFWLTLILSVVGIVVLLWMVPKVPRGQGRRLLVVKDLKAVITNLELLRLSAGIFVLHAVLTALFVAMPLLLAAADVPGIHHAWIYLGVMASAFLLMVPLIIIGERRQQLKPIFLMSVLLAAISLASLAFVTADVMAIVTAMLLFFIGFNYLEATLPSLMSKTVPASQRGAGSGMFSTCQFLGAACGGIVGGWLFSSFGVSVLMLVCAVALLVWWFLALGMVVPKRAEISAENVIA